MSRPEKPTQRGPRRSGRTPELDRLLDRARARLVAGVWLHGLGSTAAVLVAWLAFAFFADWALHVPAGVRWFHLLVACVLPGLVLWRELLVPLARVPDRAGLAVLIERAHPELGELLISGVQLQDPGHHSGAPELVERVLARAEARAREVTLAGVLDHGGPRRRFALGAAVVLAGCLAAWGRPGYASIFFERLFGGAASWPQRTHLIVSVPLAADRAQVVETPERVSVRVARGSDVPLVVRAEGEVPEDVTVHFDGGQRLVLSSGGEALFRTVLRSCQEDVAFSVVGGDDRDGLPRVEIEVLQPPDVTGLAVTVRPPAYTELPERVEHDRDVVVPEGSALEIRARTFPDGATGLARVLPEDRVVELVRGPFPRAEVAAPDGEGAPPDTALGFDLIAERSLRYRFELVDDTGLSNPDPGLFAVHVIADEDPEVAVLSPNRSDFDTVAGGTLSLRVRAEDDFGIVALEWSAETPDGTPAAGGQLEPEPLPQSTDGASPSGAGGARARVVARRRLEVAELLPPDVEPYGQQFLLRVLARDNRPSAAEAPVEVADESEDRPATRAARGVGRASPVRVRIVSEDELLRRVQDRLARVRSLAAELEELQRGRHLRVREIVAGLESDGPAEADGSGELAVATSGQRRVRGDAQALARELAAIVETVLYARLDDKAGLLLETLDARLSEVTDRSFHPAPWRELADAWRAGRAGAPAFAGQLVGILDLALVLSEEDTAAAVDALDRAALAVDLSEVHEALTSALAHQEGALRHVEELLERLAEWDNFQSILTLTRDILNRQKSLADRTRQVAK